MRVHIISNDIDLINSLKQIDKLQVYTVTKNDVNNTSADLLIISNKYIKIMELITIKTIDAKCFYLSDDEDSKTISKIDASLLALKNIIIIPGKRTVLQIQEYILNDIYDVNKENNIYTFFGSDSKTGVTSTSQAVAENLAKRHKDKKIIMLFLDGQAGFDWVNNINSKGNLSDIKVALKNNLLTVYNLKDNCYQYMPNLYMLKGEIAIKDNVYYHQSEINTLINLCKDNFDFVIIDAGNTVNLQLRMTYSALINSDNRFLITDQLPKSYDMFTKGKIQILDDLMISSFKFLILNKYIKSSSLYKKEDISDIYTLPIICTLPYVEYNYQAAAEKSISIFEQEKEYNNGIISIVEYIEKKKGIIPPKNTKKNIFKLFAKDKN